MVGPLHPSTQECNHLCLQHVRGTKEISDFTRSLRLLCLELLYTVIARLFGNPSRARADDKYRVRLLSPFQSLNRVLPDR